MGLWKHWTHEELLKFSQEVKKGFDFVTFWVRIYLLCPKHLCFSKVGSNLILN